MRGAINLLSQYTFMAWCPVKKAQGQLYPFTFTLLHQLNIRGRGRKANLSCRTMMMMTTKINKKSQAKKKKKKV
jgi:hypothetical protein